MRLWSLHPVFLDSVGLTAAWREGLLARKVLQKRTLGYRNHPQLERFRSAVRPLAQIELWLSAIYAESKVRGFDYDGSKLSDPGFIPIPIPVTRRQVWYEGVVLLDKLLNRTLWPGQILIDAVARCAHSGEFDLSPIFYEVDGDIESWERTKEDYLAQLSSYERVNNREC